MCRCMCSSVDMYICMSIIVCSYVHILHLYTGYDYAQRCEDTVSVELRYTDDDDDDDDDDDYYYYYYYYHYY